MATVPAPRRIAVPSPRRETEPRPASRPSLRVVRRADRRPRYGLLTTIGIAGVFGILLAVVMFHTVLLQNQRRLDQLHSQVRTEQARDQPPRPEGAQAQAPPPGI